jgi:hypothetical protein
VGQESVWHYLRNEAKEMRPDASRRPGKPEVYSLEYIEDFFWLRMTQMVADHSPQ